MDGSDDQGGRPLLGAACIDFCATLGPVPKPVVKLSAWLPARRSGIRTGSKSIVA